MEIMGWFLTELVSIITRPRDSAEFFNLIARMELWDLIA
jgi:hypothetical protein